jgi:signal transduction histidine kinase/CheY-like chemotaxis protein
MLQTTLIAVLLAGLAGLASFALWQGHRIRGTAARERGAEDRVARVLTELATAPDRARVFDLALDELAALRRETDCAFYGFDERGALVRQHTRGSCARMPLRLALHQGLIGEAAVSAHVLIGGVHAGPHGGGQLLACPVREGHDVLGVLAVSSATAASEHHRMLIQRIAAGLAARLTTLTEHDRVYRLTALVAVRDEALKEQAAEFGRAHRIHSRFVADVAQALRVPLTTMVANAEVLRDAVPGHLNDRQMEFVTDILDSGESVLAFVNDIADLAKVEAGMMKVDARSVDLKPLLEEVVRATQATADARSVLLSACIDPALPPVDADAGIVARMLVNLLCNAIKLAPAHGEVRLHVQLAHRDDTWWLEIAVSNSGTGISKSDQMHLFEPWMQIGYALHNGLQEASVGVAMVKRLAEMHGGTVEVRSEPGEGATFTVRLPWHGRSERAPDRGDASTEIASSPHKAVMIEASAPAANAIHEALRRAGFDAFGAAGVAAALELLSQHVPALITMSSDTSRQDMVAFMAARHARAELAAIPVMLLPPGDSDGGAVQAALAALALAPALSRVPAVLLFCDRSRDRAAVVYARSLAARLIEAGNAADALAEASAEQPDVILFDPGSPCDWRFEILDLMKALPETRAIPMVMVPRRGAPGDQVVAASVGMGALEPTAAPAREWRLEVIQTESTGERS